MNDSPVISTALFSDCRTFRYRLVRAWDQEPKILFVLLNPSHATECAGDQTVNNCIGHAMRWGYRHITVCNLFAFRSPKPSVMMAAADPIGPENDRFIKLEHEVADRTVVGWGNHGALLDRDLEVLEMLDGDLYCFDFNKPSKKRPRGQPTHPCYLHSATPMDLVLYRPGD